MTARMVRKTTRATFLPARQMPSKHRAGPRDATRTDSFLAVVVLIKPYVEMRKENN